MNTHLLVSSYLCRGILVAGARSNGMPVQEEEVKLHQTAATNARYYS